MLRIVIADDERSFRETIQLLIEQHYKTAQVVGVADSVETAYDLIMAEKPDLVLLDISMPPSNGFELLKKFSRRPFEVIFTTAYGQYAIDAIKHAAVDYLLKPIDTRELIQAVDRVQQKIVNSRHAATEPSRIALPSEKSFVFAKAADIIRIEAVERKLKVVLKNTTLEVTMTFEELERMLPESLFFRSHRTHLINLHEMKEYIPDKNGGCVIMSDGKLVPVAARKKNDFLLCLRRG
jgi:two-component system LytT family response regulator